MGRVRQGAQVVRRSWGSPTWASLSDTLRYDEVFHEWWNICSYMKGQEVPVLPNQNQSQNQNGASIDHKGRELTNIGRLWQNTSSKGNTYLRGYLEDGRAIFVFHNPQATGNSPQWNLHVAQYTEDERKQLADEAEARRKDYEQRQAQNLQQKQQPQQPLGQAPSDSLPI